MRVTQLEWEGEGTSTVRVREYNMEMIEVSEWCADVEVRGRDYESYEA